MVPSAALSWQPILRNIESFALVQESLKNLKDLPEKNFLGEVLGWITKETDISFDEITLESTRLVQEIAMEIKIQKNLLPEARWIIYHNISGEPFYDGTASLKEHLDSLTSAKNILSPYAQEMKNTRTYEINYWDRKSILTLNVENSARQSRIYRLSGNLAEFKAFQLRNKEMLQQIQDQYTQEIETAFEIPEKIEDKILTTRLAIEEMITGYEEYCNLECKGQPTKGTCSFDCKQNRFRSTGLGTACEKEDFSCLMNQSRFSSECRNIPSIAQKECLERFYQDERFIHPFPWDMQIVSP